MKPIYTGINAFILIVLVTGCNETSKNISKSENKEPKSVVFSPFKNVKLPTETFTITPGKEQIITSSNGSKITIPKESLVDENGDLIQEPVTISLKNFMDPAEIMTAGIPMKYSDDSTSITPFQSAGMFEIQASTGSGSKVMINQDHPISMELATYRSEKGFDNFYLDTLTGKWNKTENDNLHLNIDKELVKKQMANLKTKTVFGGNAFVFDFDNLLDEFLNNDYQTIYPYLVNKKKKLPSKLLQYGIEGENIWDYNKITLNGNEIPAYLVVWEKVNKDKFPVWAENIPAKHKKLEGNIYELTLENPKDKKEIFKTKIKAKISIKSIFKVAPEKWSAAYEKTLKEIEEHELTLSKMNDLSRTLQINQFGIYNCDRLYDQPEKFLAKVNFIIPKGKKGFAPDRFFYISKKDKVCIDYTFKQEVDLTLCNDPSATLFTVLEGDILAQVSNEELSKCSKDKTGTQTLHFKTAKKIEKVDDLKTLMGI
jgi:effector-binding domain-containing protein